MPQLNFDNNNPMGVQPETMAVDTQTDTLPVGTQADVPTVSTVVTHNDNDIPEAALWIEEGEEKAVAGLTADELNDPNLIQVHISDPNAPLLVLFGLSLPCYVSSLLLRGVFEKLEKHPEKKEEHEREDGTAPG